MTEEAREGVNIASRIKQFSGFSISDKDSNGNVMNMKPNPQPRRRHHTEEFHNETNMNKIGSVVSRSTSNPVSKPVLPVKPFPKSPDFSQRPSVTPRVKSPDLSNPLRVQNSPGQFKKSPEPPRKPQSVIKDIGNTDKHDGNPSKNLQKPAVQTRPRSAISSQLEVNQKPAARPLSQDFIKRTNINESSKESWKKYAGPPAKPIPSGPSNLVKPNSQSINPEPKPPRGSQSKFAYENHEIFSGSVKSSEQNNLPRCGTLDGLTFTSGSNTVITPEEDYNYAYQALSKQQPFEGIYDVADTEAIRGFANASNNISYKHADSDGSDYELPPDANGKPAYDTEDSDSDSDDNYDMPNEPPPVPRHKTAEPPPVPKHKTSNEMPPIPEHKNITENNLESSSSDEDVCPDYMDPECEFTKPPVSIYSSSNTRMSMRRGNIHYQPAEYMPVAQIVPNINEDDDLMNDCGYVDPSVQFSRKPKILRDEETDEDIYGDEPLYQVYNAEVNESNHRQSKKKDDENDNSELTADLLHSGKSIRMLWSELPSVRSSGTLNSISPSERKRQEAMFEVITSEASYLKSLDILVNHFMLNRAFLPNPNMPSSDPEESQLLDRQEYHFLFTGLSAIKSASERFLRDLRRRQQESIIISSISDIIHDYAEKHFQCYVKYCSNQVFQDRTLQALLHSNPQFAETLTHLETNKICQGLSMQSFLTLPMQRITRLPLLVDAICSRCEPGSKEFQKTDSCLKAINIVVRESNEGARKMERTEEMYFIQKTLTFKTKPIPLVSSSRWLVKKGDVMCLHEEGRFSKYKNQIRQIFKGKCKPIYLFLFTDLVLVTKMKNDDNFKVIDQCQRSLLKVEVLPNIPDPEPPKVGTLATLNINPLQYAFTLILLENVNNKTVDYHCFLSTQSDKTRWLEAFNPRESASEIEGEAIYEEWDCPQVQVIHPYPSQQSDELTLIEGDVISVLRKLPDGWAEGMRLRDDEKGWFPYNHTDEIDSKHVRAKNLMQRYRLVTASKNIINQIIGK